MEFGVNLGQEMTWSFYNIGGTFNIFIMNYDAISRHKSTGVCHQN